MLTINLAIRTSAMIFCGVILMAATSARQVVINPVNNVSRSEYTESLVAAKLSYPERDTFMVRSAMTVQIQQIVPFATWTAKISPKLRAEARRRNVPIAVVLAMIPHVALLKVIPLKFKGGAFWLPASGVQNGTSSANKDDVQ
ncbi:MAG: hypothetical protein M3N19_02725 [Candidatus Eremiobacteraeota bacterium]|nr:hypothetical protein [Candidatus Eremiobacteraeota bacterium]